MYRQCAVNVEAQQQKQQRQAKSKDEHDFGQKTEVLQNQYFQHKRQRQPFINAYGADGHEHAAVHAQQQDERAQGQRERGGKRTVFHPHQFVMAARAVCLPTLPKHRNLNQQAAFGTVQAVRGQHQAAQFRPMPSEKMLRRGCLAEQGHDG